MRASEGKQVWVMISENGDEHGMIQRMMNYRHPNHVAP